MAVSNPPETPTDGPPQAGKRRGAVLITGRGIDVAFHLDEDIPLDQVALELDAELAGHSALFSKGGITVDTGRRRLSEDQEEEIRRIFREKSGLKVSRFISSDARVADTQTADSDPDGVAVPASGQPPARRAGKAPTPLAEFSSADLARALSGLSSRGQRSRDHALVVRATVRSGETVEHDGDLVVLGDVNPGSEILADGDIVVMGSLKGLPHAGASGDNKAAVIALEIAAPRLRIGGAEANAPPPDGVAPRKRKQESQESIGAQPQIAYIRRGTIHISPFVGRFARYTKGVPYEG